jgi:hypothetical protein
MLRPSISADIGATFASNLAASERIGGDFFFQGSHYLPNSTGRNGSVWQLSYEVRLGCFLVVVSEVLPVSGICQRCLIALVPGRGVQVRKDPAPAGARTSSIAGMEQVDRGPISTEETIAFLECAAAIAKEARGVLMSARSVGGGGSDMTRELDGVVDGLRGLIDVEAAPCYAFLC